MNGGVKKILIAMASAAATGLTGYLLHNIAKVQPLVVEVSAIDEKLDMQTGITKEYRDDQREWNRMFLNHQESTEIKIDAVLKAVQEKP